MNEQIITLYQNGTAMAVIASEFGLSEHQIRRIVRKAGVTPRPRGKPLDDIAGRRFGKLTTVCIDHEYVSPKGGRDKMWRCNCDCGAVTIVRRVSLICGDSKSCGCGPRGKRAQTSSTMRNPPLDRGGDYCVVTDTGKRN